MKAPNKLNLLIIKEEISYILCPACNAVGIRTRTFRNHKFVQSCRECKGTGRKEIVKRTEISLQDALKQLHNYNTALNEKEKNTELQG